MKRIIFGLYLLVVSGFVFSQTTHYNYDIYNPKKAEDFLNDLSHQQLKRVDNGSNVYRYYGWLIHCSYNRFEEEKICAFAKENTQGTVNFYIGLVNEKIHLVFGDVNSRNQNIYNIAMKVDNNQTIYEHTTLTPNQIFEQLKNGKTLYYRYRTNSGYEEYELDLSNLNKVFIYINQLDINNL